MRKGSRLEPSEQENPLFPTQVGCAVSWSVHDPGARSLRWQFVGVVFRG